MSALITRERIRLQVEAGDWTEAIRQSADLLLRDGCITAGYVDAIFKSFETNGDYMIIIPEVVLSHARPEMGALGTGISLITLRQPVPYLDEADKMIAVVFTLATTDSTEHLQTMQAMAEVLVDDEALQRIKTSSDVDEVLGILTPAQS